MTFLVGLDLSWTGRNETGLCVLESSGDGVLLVRLDATVWPVDSLAEYLGGLCVAVTVAVDAPLVRTAQCTAERELARAFGRYKASAYNANVDFLTRKGLLAGPELGETLRARGFALDPLAISPFADGRHAFEMYPHAVHVVHFKLHERLKYKKGPLPLRREGIHDYQRLLAALLKRDLPAVAASPSVLAAFDGGGPVLGARQLKHLEDTLDGLTCAYAAWRAWREGLHPCEVFGNATDGHIVVPGLRFDPRFHATG